MRYASVAFPMPDGPPPLHDDAPATRVATILLVEDDAVDVMNVRRAFARAGIASALHVADDGLEGLAMLRDGRVTAGRRLVLLDLNMPRMGGREFLRALRADPVLSATPVVVLTTSDDANDLADAYAHHVAGYLLKPVTPARFLDLMTIFDRYWSMVEFP